MWRTLVSTLTSDSRSRRAAGVWPIAPFSTFTASVRCDPVHRAQGPQPPNPQKMVTAVSSRNVDECKPLGVDKTDTRALFAGS